MDRHILKTAAVLLAMATAHDSFGGGPCSGVKGGCGRAVYRGKYPELSPSHPIDPPSRPDPVPRRRAEPEPVTRPISPVLSLLNAPKSRTSFRSEPRTTARTQAWGGTSSAYDSFDPADEKLKAPAGTPTNSLPPRPTFLGPEFLVTMNSGKVVQIAAYENTDTGYRVTTLNGGKMLIDRGLVRKIEPI